KFEYLKKEWSKYYVVAGLLDAIKGISMFNHPGFRNRAFFLLYPTCQQDRFADVFVCYEASGFRLSDSLLEAVARVQPADGSLQEFWLEKLHEQRASSQHIIAVYGLMNAYPDASKETKREQIPKILRNLRKAGYTDRAQEVVWAYRTEPLEKTYADDIFQSIAANCFTASPLFYFNKESWIVDFFKVSGNWDVDGSREFVLVGQNESCRMHITRFTPEGQTEIDARYFPIQNKIVGTDALTLQRAKQYFLQSQYCSNLRDIKRK
ncbi:MAG: hypothetical protein AABX82_01265, partial [Nanoarchaeota archaeon]